MNRPLFPIPHRTGRTAESRTITRLLAGRAQDIAHQFAAAFTDGFVQEHPDFPEKFLGMCVKHWSRSGRGILIDYADDARAVVGGAVEPRPL